MKKIFFITFIFLLPFVTIAQQYGNEWINYNQTYFKIPITQEGIYRISRQSLINSGLNLGSIDTRNIQLFYKGQEQYIYIYGESNGTLTTNGYIEFYAKGNDGWLDSLLFEPTTDITNPYYSLYTDTAYYFLTYNNLLSGNKRVMLETDTDFGNTSYQTVSNCVVDVLYQNPQYYYSADNGPRYLKGEGWFDTYFSWNSPMVKTLLTPGFVSGVDSTKINVSVATNSHFGHHLNVTFNSTIFFDEIFSGATSVKKTYSTIENLTPTTNINFSSINDISATTDLMEVAYIFLTYHRNFIFNGLFKQNFKIKDSNGNKTLLQVEQFLRNNAVLWDLTNHKKIPVVYQNSKLNAIIPNLGNEKECYIIAEDSVKYVSKLEKKNFVNYLPTGINATDYVIITNPLLWTRANDYKNYRISKGYKANCYDVEQLYDQFSYGIKKHPLAIKNFLKYISTPLNSTDSLPKFVFLIGKGIHSGTWSYWESFRKNTANFEAALVPSFGSPSSDNLLVTKIFTNNPTQDIPIGRIAATSDDEVNIYLSKVIDHESATQAEWMKRVIHFGGGTTTGEQNSFAGYLNNFATIISDTLFGGNVNTFLKTTSLPIQITVADTVRNLINDGTSLITFFGHGYTDGFDQNIEEPDVYNNRYKYPLLIANSCLTGDIHLPAPKKISERWIFEPQKGAIGFLATVDLGYPNLLNMFTDELYKQFAYKNYTQPIGKCIRDGNQQLFNNYSSSILNTCLEFTLHGDPAVRLKCFPLPDLTINNSSVSSVPQIVSSEIEYFYVKTIVTNIGKAINDTFAINITRTYPDGTKEYYLDWVYGCHFKDTVLTKIPVNYIKGTGINNFCVKVDALDSIVEFDETNNNACTNITIRSNDLMPIYPYEYAIFPNNTVTLKASTGYPFIGIQTYMFEIDTTDLFNSAFKDSGTVTQAGGVVQWQPLITLTDSTVYFWRVSPVPQGSQTFSWKESSFIYIPGKTGWSQAHFFQYKKDDFQSIDYNRQNRTLDFVNAPKTLHVHDIGSANTSAEYNETGFFIDAINDRTSCGAYGAVLAVVVDPMTLIPWQCNIDSFGQVNWPKCSTHNGYNKYFVFYADTAHLLSLATFVTNLPDSVYFFIYTFRTGNMQLWPEETYQAFENLSSNTLYLRNLPDNNVPYVFFCKKGDLASAVDTFGVNPHDTVDFYTSLQTNFTSGKVASTLIGPATSWQTLHWLQYSIESPTKDSVHLEVKAYKPNNDSITAIPFLSTSQYDISDLYNYVDVATYPYLQLNLLTKDDSLKTPSQLKRWQVTYDEAPETAINPTKGYLFESDTLQEGDNMKFAVATENVSRYDMDSLLVKYWIQDRNNQIINLPDAYRKLRKHPAGDVIIDTITYNTTGLAGLNHIWYEVNPVDTNTGKYAQLEQYHFNNIAEKPFYVSSDRTNPLLDVTFDNIHILNGDIVSAKPYILVTLKDENKFLALNDTLLFGLYISNKTTGIENRIYFNNPQLQYTFAQLPKNSFKIEYRPILADGKFQLRIQAKDVSNNESGDVDYRIDFEVINKATVTNVYNYPNPFSTSTRFVFTLTGSEIPDDFRIQIFTITGKFIREIGLNELGNVHIGNNITQFAWDGTDMYNDKLANGVYFFKVIARLNSETIEHRATDADKFFKQGVGKMYILR